ncbi:hypothetical protein LTR08_005401 [Meristemomyces frigidus]|nr:hypothetical protein LTR08_005401 [Meristemomyces frigidus]
MGAHFFATSGRTAWRFLPSKHRRQETARLTEALQDGECPTDVVQLLLETVAILVDPKAGNNVELASEDHEADSGTETHELDTLNDHLLSELHAFFAQGHVFTDFRRAKQLTQVDSLLASCIGYTKKIALLCLAKMLWPTRKFEATTQPLEEFCKALDAQVQKDIWRFDNIAQRRTPPAEHDSQTQQVPEAPRILGSFPGAEKYTLEIFDSRVSSNYLNQVKRVVAPAQDDVAALRAEADKHKTSIFHAMTTLPLDANAIQKKEWLITMRSFQDDGVTFRYLQALAESMCDELLRLHEVGCILFPWQHVGPQLLAADQNIQCSERLRAIITALSHKFVVKECFTTDGIRRVVAFPNGIKASKVASHLSNEARKKNGADGERVAKEATSKSAVRSPAHEEEEWNGSDERGTAIKKSKGGRKPHPSEIGGEGEGTDLQSGGNADGATQEQAQRKRKTLTTGTAYNRPVKSAKLDGHTPRSNPSHSMRMTTPHDQHKTDEDGEEGDIWG